MMDNYWSCSLQFSKEEVPFNFSNMDVTSQKKRSNDIPICCRECCIVITEYGAQGVVHVFYLSKKSNSLVHYAFADKQ